MLIVNLVYQHGAQTGTWEDLNICVQTENDLVYLFNNNDVFRFCYDDFQAAKNWYENLIKEYIFIFSLLS